MKYFHRFLLDYTRKIALGPCLSSFREFFTWIVFFIQLVANRCNWEPKDKGKRSYGKGKTDKIKRKGSICGKKRKRRFNSYFFSVPASKHWFAHWKTVFREFSTVIESWHVWYLSYLNFLFAELLTHEPMGAPLFLIQAHFSNNMQIFPYIFCFILDTKIFILCRNSLICLRNDSPIHPSCQPKLHTVYAFDIIL